MSVRKLTTKLSAIPRFPPLQATTEEQESLWQKKDVAAFLRISERSVETLVSRRQLPFLRLGHRRLRFRKADVLRALNRFTTTEIS